MCLSSADRSESSGQKCFVAAGLGAAAISTYVLMLQRRQRTAAAQASGTPSLSIEDLRSSKHRENHVQWNADLHKRGASVFKVIGAQGVGAYVVIGHRAVLWLSQDERLSSNPFTDGRLIALNTMSRDRHAVIAKLLAKSYQHRHMRLLETEFLETAQRYAGETVVVGGTLDVMTWTKRVHMANTLKVILGSSADDALHLVDPLVRFNDEMVKLVAPLGGVGLPCPPVFSMHTLHFIRGALAAAPSLLKFLWRAGIAGFQITRPDKTLSRSDLGSGVWFYPELLPEVPKYFLLLMDLWDATPSPDLPASPTTPSSGSPIEALKAAVGRGDVSLAEALVTIVQLMVNMTSANALANMVFRLCDEPAPAPEDDVALDKFVAEVLRLDAPLQRNPRHTLEPLEVDGMVIPRGANVLLFIGAANMDPSVFKDPEAFRPGREEQTTAFGAGPHYCLGSYLVKTEMREALRFLLRRCQGFKVEQFERVGKVDVGNYGFESLRVSMSPKPSV